MKQDLHSLEEKYQLIYPLLFPGEEVRVLDNSVIDNIIPNKYFVTSFGRAFTYIFNRIEPLTVDKIRHNSIAQNISISRISGYPRTHISIYRAILMIFNPVENMNNYEVEHIDGNPENNRLDNLRWRKGSYLTQYDYNNKTNPIVYFGDILQPGEMVLPLTEYHIANIKSNYFVSNIGNVYSISKNANREIINLKQETTRDGYKRLQLYTKDNKIKHFSVHRLVLIVFRYRPDYENFMVNHKDGIRNHNYVDPYNPYNDNIEWCTAMYNSMYMVNNGTAYNQLPPETVLEIKKLLDEGMEVKVVASKFNICLDTVYGIKNNKRYKPITRGGLEEWQI